MHDRLTMSPIPENPGGIVLMLHGGAQSGYRPVDGRSLALRRTRRMFRTISEDLVASGVAVALLRFKVKGWNAAPGRTPSPVRDARAALRYLGEELPGVPVVLLGHSMGARTAAWVADEPSVVGVVGLAPWFPHDDPLESLAGTQLVAAHGHRDRITSARASRRFLERADEVAASTRFIDMGGLGHYMLTGASRWNEVAVTETRGILARVRDSR